MQRVWFIERGRMVMIALTARMAVVTVATTIRTLLSTVMITASKIKMI